ncbi:MAG: endonuclease/exonuclease/phosphatase family protein [Chitinophagales bacterium]|nr:endonuclease/exonuclease/phosphatase family protein [Chitinophagales bacterium]
MLIVISHCLFANISICSWNLFDFGKTRNNEEIEYIANTVKDFDVVAIQEVVAKDPGGAQAVARLADALSRKGAKWDYVISDITSSTSYKAERYAFIWKSARIIKIGDAWLEKKYNHEIDREPYFATFQSDGKLFTLVNFHAITKSEQPEREVKYLKFLPAEYPAKNLIFCGDFNLPPSHSVFNPLKKIGYKSIFIGEKTSLKQECIYDDCLASEFDNMFYESTKVTLISSGIIHFYKSFTCISEARMISDHVPIYFEFSLN